VLHDPAKKRASRRKGADEERAIARYLQSRGFAAVKSSRNGYRGPDLTVPLLGVERVVEVKCRANGFRELYAWLADRDILIVRANRREPLCILPMWLASEIAAEAEGQPFGPNRPLVKHQKGGLWDYLRVTTGVHHKCSMPPQLAKCAVQKVTAPD
jgi:hypothetical protein